MEQEDLLAQERLEMAEAGLLTRHVSKKAAGFGVMDRGGRFPSPGGRILSSETDTREQRMRK